MTKLWPDSIHQKQRKAITRITIWVIKEGPRDAHGRGEVYAIIVWPRWYLVEAMTTVRKGKIRVVDGKSRQASAGVGDQGGGIEGNIDIDVDIVDVSWGVRIVRETGNACWKWCLFLYRDGGAVLRVGEYGGMPHFGNRAGQMCWEWALSASELLLREAAGG